jgi:prepilin-type N-terminal cleavage/methylation domain-containing protein
VRTRERGTTILELMIVVAVLSILLTAAFFLSDTMTKLNNSGSVEQYTQGQCRRIIDFVATDYRQSAAWTYFKYSPPSSTTPTRLTYWDNNLKLTRGVGTYQGSFTFPTVPASSPPTTWQNAATDAIAFNRIVDANVASNVGGYPAYLIFDFEPKEATKPLSDVNGNGGTGNIVVNQTGRMDDDPTRYYILYQTVTKKGRLIVQRVRGVPMPVTSDASATVLNPPDVMDIGDLGPATLLNQGQTINNVLIIPGRLEINAVDTGDPSGAGAVQIHVVARGQYAERKGSIIDTYTAELMTQVYCYAGSPPF